MISIEFIGPSCIGKTYFLKEFSRSCNADSSWDTHENFLNKGKNNGAKLNTLLSRIIQKLNRNSFSKKSHRSSLFESYSNEIETILDVFIESQKNSKDLAWQKIRLFEYFTNSILYKSLLIDSYMKYSPMFRPLSSVS